MSEETQVGPVSVEEYLRLEETSDIRHEYVGGYLYAMTGASRRHNRIVTNLASSVLEAADAQNCEVYSSGVKAQVSEAVIYYPDLLVTCDPLDNDAYISRRPCLVVEVLSPTTERTDRREKYFVYTGITSLRTYLIVHQDRQLVERHWREDGDDEWRTQVIAGGVVPLPCPNTQITVEQIYQNLPSLADETQPS